MREILFRGKPKNKADYELLKTMYKDNCKDGFIYGSLVISHGKYYICIMALCQINSLVNNGTTTMFEVIPETVGQYTGLKDKNGKRIFEGDIVTTKFNERNKPYATIYDEELAAFIGRDKNNFNFTTLGCIDNSLIEIIGNIHDNPELLK